MYIDVEIGNGKQGRLGIYNGENAKNASSRFQVIFKLN